MANRYATASGLWSNPAIWDGGVALPTTGDTVRPNGFIVTIDQDIDVTTLTCNASAPAVAGGYFQLLEANVPAPGITLDCNIVRPAAGGAGVQLLLLNGAISKPITIIGNVEYLDSAGNTYTIYQSSITQAFPATFTITGNVTMNPSGASGTYTTVSLAGIFSNIVVNGDIESVSTGSPCFTRPRGTNADTSVQLMTVNGNIICSGTSSGLVYYPSHTAGVTANMPLVINGNVVNSSSGAGYSVYTAHDGAAAHITVNGDVIHSGAGTGPCIGTVLVGGLVSRRISIFGDIICSGIASSSMVAVVHAHTGNLYVQGDVTASENKSCLQALACRVMVEGTLTAGPDGWFPISVRNFRTPNAGRTIWVLSEDANSWPTGGDTTPLVLSNYFDETPPQDDVRDGVAYGVGGSLTGTLAVPDPGSVALGVPTDDTEGEAVLLIDSGISTIASTGAQIAAGLSA